MKRTICVIIATLFAIAANAQDHEMAVKLLKEDLTRAGMNQNSYEFVDYHYSKVPKSYKAVYISHFGRHGSRSNWGDKHYVSVIDILTKAKESGFLSAEGDSLLNETILVLKGYNGMDGRLTPRGVREHAALAKRMYERNPEIFRKGSKKVRVESSNVPRCIMSMASFTNSLTSEQPDLTYSFDTGEKIFEYINNDASKHMKVETQRMVDSLVANTPTDTVSILSTLFTDSSKARKLIKSVDKFQTDIWETACIAEDFDIPNTPYRFLPFDAVFRLYDQLNRLFYMRHCNSIEYGEERMKLCDPLVDVVVKYADEALATGRVCADLKFSHDYPVLALASRLHLNGVGDRMTFDEIPDKWFGSQWICMASNIQMVFYKNKKGHVIVKVLYNEEEKQITGLTPIPGTTCFYEWTDVRTMLTGE